MSELRKIIVSGWKFNVDCDLDLPRIILDYISANNDSNSLKKKNNRQIFRIQQRDKSYFIKYNYPLNFFHAAKDILIPKARSEYRSWLLIKNAGVPSTPAETPLAGRLDAGALRLVRQMVEKLLNSPSTSSAGRRRSRRARSG